MKKMIVLQQWLLLILMIFSFFSGSSQTVAFTKDDTLRGSITPERKWWDLKYYHLNIEVEPSRKFISGSVLIQYEVKESYQKLQVDLQPPLTISKILQNAEELSFEKVGKNAHIVSLKQPQEVGSTQAIEVFYSGNPIEAKNPPWGGGVQWTTTGDGKPFIATACQGLGASGWWPCKDHMYDEPDSMLMSVTVPSDLVDVSNGRLRGVRENNSGTKTYDWFVSNPINNYGVNINIANYVHFSDTLHGENGVLDLDYYVLPANLEKAKEQFKQGKLTVKAFEYWFGPYPFYEDGYKLVEVPYLGMEHQSSVTYGNGYQNGYRGRDLSDTGWGLKWDFIIVHESGHEWFANNVTYRDVADMWIHESFTNYSESLFTEFYYGKEAATDYVNGTRKNIQNDKPIIGYYDVNKRGSGDMYYKGGNMLHTIRHSINDDKLFREILRGINKTFYHQTVTSKQIEDYISAQSGVDLQKVFDQYLRTTQIPNFEYYLEKNRLHFRWTNCVEGFNMQLFLPGEASKVLHLKPTTEWQHVELKGQRFDKKLLERLYYVKAIESVRR